MPGFQFTAYRLPLLTFTVSRYSLYLRGRMKILCLHGAGSSGVLLEEQMANFRRELDPSFELVFVDGPFESERGPGT